MIENVIKLQDTEGLGRKLLLTLRRPPKPLTTPQWGLSRHLTTNADHACTFEPSHLQHCKIREKLNRGISKPGGFPFSSGKVQILSRTLSGLFLIGAVNRLRMRKRTNRENPRRVPGKSGKFWKNRESPKKDKKGRTSPDQETLPFETPPFSSP